MRNNFTTFTSRSSKSIAPACMRRCWYSLKISAYFVSNGPNAASAAPAASTNSFFHRLMRTCALGRVSLGVEVQVADHLGDERCESAES